MLPVAHHLKGWRYLYSFHHCHCHLRLLTSSAVKFESESITDQVNSFGHLAADRHRHKNNSEKESDSFTENLSKIYRGFPKLSQHYSDSRRDSRGLCQDNILDKWHQFRVVEDQETESRQGSGEWDDAENYQYPVSKTTLRSLHQEGTQWEVPEGKDLSPSAAESLKDVRDASSSRGTFQNDVQKGGMFGNLSPQHVQPEPDEGDLREEVYQDVKLGRKHRPHFYGFKMKKLCKERKLAEAIKILEEEMPAAGTKPDNFCFQVLINACGRAGYTKKAFQLYNKMKKHGLKVEPVTYTGLFLACAHSPWPTTDGLQRAKHLRSLLLEKNVQFNQIICHAMIKAFGWCGDMETAFQVVDEMVRDGVLVTTETINFLLQACITNKEAGFRHAVKVWRKMRELKMKPDIHSYNLLMRVTKECGAGNPSLTDDLLQEEDKSHTNKQKLNHEELNSKVQLLTSEKNIRNAPKDSDVCHMHNYDAVQNLNESTNKSVLPNIIGKKLTTGSVVALGSLEKPCDRLALLGGPSGILMQMKRDRVIPDLKTFTQMLESLPPDTQAEEALMESMKNVKLEPDTQFFNMLIKKRNFRHDIQGGQNVVTKMQDYNLIPDLITYGCLALGCRKLHSASHLLKDMDANNFRPNLEIMTMLIKNSLVRQDYIFTVAMLNEMKKRGISANDSLLSILERARTTTRNILLDKHNNTSVKQEKQEKKKRAAEVFLSAYKVWLKDSKICLPEHPWTQYR